MRAWLLTGHGDFEALEYRGDVAVPAPGPGEVLVRVRAAAVNNTDINLRIGWYAKRNRGIESGEAGAARPRDLAGPGGWSGTSVAFPLIQGADACGEIAAVGTGVSSARIGERVIVNPVLGPAPQSPEGGARYLGSDCNGAFAEFVVVPQANAVRIESTLSDAELASFPCSYSTAENMLTRAHISRGDAVLVTGASGGVGTAAVQLALRRGARVIAVAGAQKAARLRALGAAEILARNEDLLARLGSESIDAVIDVVGGAPFTSLLEVLKCGGRYAVAGAIGGPIVPLDLRTLYLKDLTLLGCTVPEPGVFANLVRYIEAGEIRAVLASTFTLQELPQAQRAFLEKAHVGKIVLLM
jgi:NADPH:quinone reductase-like Zn-dependent oxidoreductase